MNLRKLSVVLTACVAVVLSLSACTTPINTKALEPKPELLAPTEPSVAYDEWLLWTAEPKSDTPTEDNENINVLARELDLGVVFEQPTDSYYAAGWGGVAQYGSQCIIMLAVNEQTEIDGSVWIEVWSRYDGSLEISMEWVADYEFIRTYLAPYALWCEAGGPIPMPGDGTELFIQEQPVDA